jgi:hypothetical protein
VRSCTAKSWNNLSFDVATFDRVSPRMEQSQQKFRAEYANGRQESDHIYTGGITYTPFASLTTSLWATQAEDLWNQYYFGATARIGRQQGAEPDHRPELLQNPGFR